MYWPAAGRFVSADSIIPDPTKAIDHNRYAYAHGDPLRYTDPTGHCGYTYCIPSGNPYQAIVIGQSIPIVPRYTGLPALTVSPPQVSLAGPASAVFAQADTLIGPVMAGGAQASTLAAMAAAGAGATEGAGHSELGGETAGPSGKGGGGFGEEPNNSSKSNAKDPRIQSNPSGTQGARLALGRSEVVVQLAKEKSATHLMNHPRWQQEFMRLMNDNQTRAFFSMEGIDLTSTQTRWQMDRVYWRGVDWELYQIQNHPEWWDRIEWIGGSNPFK